MANTVVLSSKQYQQNTNKYFILYSKNLQILHVGETVVVAQLTTIMTILSGAVVNNDDSSQIRPLCLW